MFTQLFGQAQIKENIKALRHWPLSREFTGDRWILRTKGPVSRKMFPFDDVIMNYFRGKQTFVASLLYPGPISLSQATWKQSQPPTEWIYYRNVYICNLDPLRSSAGLDGNWHSRHHRINLQGLEGHLSKIYVQPSAVLRLDLARNPYTHDTFISNNRFQISTNAITKSSAGTRNILHLNEIYHQQRSWFRKRLYM